MIEFTGTLETSMMRLGGVFLHMQADGYPDSREPSKFFEEMKGKHVKITIEEVA